MLTTRPGLGLPTDGHDPEGGGSTLSAPACPLARQGLGSRLMPSCPGYEAAPLSFAGLGAGESLGERVTCRHLGTQRGARGFVSACRHPGGVPAEALELARRAGRRSSTPRAN
jgi:hypothetical protein